MSRRFSSAATIATRAERVFEAVVDDDMGELVARGQLLLGDRQATLDLLAAVGAPSDQACAQCLQGRRSDENLHSLGHRGTNLARSLNLDLEHDRDSLPRRAAQARCAGSRSGGRRSRRARRSRHPARAARIHRSRGSDNRCRPAPRGAARAWWPTPTARAAAGAPSDPRIRVPLPTPEGPVITKTRATRETLMSGAAGDASQRRSRETSSCAGALKGRRSSCSARYGRARGSC